MLLIDKSILKEYNNINDLLKGYYTNDVSFNINSFMRTLQNVNNTDINENNTIKVYFNYDEIDRDCIRMVITFAVYDKSNNISLEVAHIEFTAAYVNRICNDDVRILHYYSE